MSGLGWTSLFHAAMYSENPEVISVLLKAGADPNAKDEFGKTVLDYAKENESIKGTPVYWKLNEASYE